MYKCWQHWSKHSTNKPTFHFCPSLIASHPHWVNNTVWFIMIHLNIFEQSQPFPPVTGRVPVPVPRPNPSQPSAPSVRQRSTQWPGQLQDEGQGNARKLDDLMILHFSYFPIPRLVTERFKYLEHVELDLQFVIRGETVPLHQHESNLVRTASERPLFALKGPKCTVLLVVIRCLVAVFAWLAVAWHGYSLNSV